jgi:UDP-glucose 4-epimerase
MNSTKRTHYIHDAGILRKPPTLITGGDGFIGAHLARYLVRSGYPVTIIDNLSRGRLANLRDCMNEIRIVEADICNASILSRVMSSVEVVFHLAAQSKVIEASKNIDECIASNIDGTMNVVQAARSCGVRRLVFTSSREVYGEPARLPVSETAALRPKNPYGMSKVAGEMCCAMARDGGLEITILRVANAYGPGDRDRVIPNFIERARTGRPLVVNGGDQVLDFVPVEFVVEALIRAAFGRYVSGPLNIGSGIGTTILQLAEKILTLTRSRSRLEIRQKRDIEVSRFIAGTGTAARLLGLKLGTDSLAGLENMLLTSERRTWRASGL